jgi:hypothetical protein
MFTQPGWLNLKISALYLVHIFCVTYITYSSREDEISVTRNLAMLDCALSVGFIKK